MFCTKCGTSLVIDAQFCTGCGAAVSAAAAASAPAPDAGEPVLVAHPVFARWPVLLHSSVFSIFFTTFGLGILSVFFLGGIQDQLHIANLPLGIRLSAFAVLGLVTLNPLIYLMKKRMYRNTEFRFYRDRMEFTMNHLGQEMRTIPYQRISEVNLHQGIIQRRLGLGTIFFSTPDDTTGFSNDPATTVNSGIAFVDVRDPDTVYATIKGLLGQSQ